MSRREPTRVKCCGSWLSCPNFTNTCPTCDTDYNWHGAQLAPREQWGEETGESYADIVGPGDPFDDWELPGGER